MNAQEPNNTTATTPPAGQRWKKEAVLEVLPQWGSALPASFIFITGGMNMAWSLGFTMQPIFLATEFKISWFGGFIIGALMGAFATKRLRKKWILLFSALLVIIGGIDFVTMPTNVEATVLGFYLVGIANGITCVSTQVMIGEIASNGIRGMLAATVESTAFCFGLCVQIVHMRIFANTTLQDEAHGIIVIVLGGIAMILGALLIIETPVYFLVRDKEEQASDCLRRLQIPAVITAETQVKIKELYEYVNENANFTFGTEDAPGLTAVFKLCFYRGLVAMSLSAVIIYGFAWSVMETFASTYAWPYMVFCILRWVGALIGALFVDTLGRKITMLVGLLPCSATAMGLGGIFIDISNTLDSVQMEIAMAFFFAFQLFAGIMLVSSSAYLTEAFPLAIKPYLIAATYITEMLIYIVTSVCDLNQIGMPNYYFIMGGLCLLFFLFGIFCMPETSNKSLRDAQEKFHSFNGVKV